MAITRTPIVDDSGSGQDGTVIDNAWKQEFYDQIDGVVANTSTSVTTYTTPGTFDVTTPDAQIRLLRLYPSGGDIVLRSVTAGSVGDLLVVQGVGGVGGGFGLNRLLHQDAGAPAANRLANFVSSASTNIHGFGSALYTYDVGGYWSIVSHEQGSPITAPFVAGNFTAASGVWTVASGDLVTSAYVLRGRVLEYFLTLSTSTVSLVTNSVSINQAAFGGYTPLMNSWSTGAVGNPGGSPGNVLSIANAAGSSLIFYPASGTFPAGGLSLSYVCRFSVT